MINFTLCRNKIGRPFRVFNPERPFLLLAFIGCFVNGYSQNKLQKQVSAQHIETISINGNQIFNISVTTSKSDTMQVISILDGEYQNDFQLVIKEENKTLNLSLEHLSLLEIPDDKRNAHKVTAATLHLEIPEQLILRILSDIDSVDIKGNFKVLYIELLQGQCHIVGEAKAATINTLDGDINLVTKSARIEATSNHGNVAVDEFSSHKSLWKLKSINGNITVVKLD